MTEGEEKILEVLKDTRVCIKIGLIFEVLTVIILIGIWLNQMCVLN